MNDPRVDRLARLIVEYSLGLRPGQVLRVDGDESAAPLAVAIQAAALAAGAHSYSKVELDGILATMYDSRTVHSREVLARVVEAFDDHVYHTVIGRTVRFPETTVAGEPITTYASNSVGAAAYRQLAREVLARCHAE